MNVGKLNFFVMFFFIVLIIEIGRIKFSGLSLNSLTGLAELCINGLSGAG
jgi:hypothetical protein